MALFVEEHAAIGEPVQHVLEQRAVAGLALAQRLLGPLASGDLGLQGAVGRRQVVGTLLLPDVDDGRTAEVSRPLAVHAAARPSTSTSTGCLSPRSLISHDCRVSAVSTRLAEIGKRRAAFRGHELPKPLLQGGLSGQAQQGGTGQVDFPDACLAVPREIAYRGEVEEVVVLLGCLLGRRVGPLQFLVLHLQFDLVDLQLVEQGPGVDLGRALRGRGVPLAGVALPLGEGRSLRSDSWSCLKAVRCKDGGPCSR